MTPAAFLTPVPVPVPPPRTPPWERRTGNGSRSSVPECSGNGQERQEWEEREQRSKRVTHGGPGGSRDPGTSLPLDDSDRDLNARTEPSECACSGMGDDRMCAGRGCVKHGTSKRPADGGNGSHTSSDPSGCAHLLVGFGVANARNLGFGELRCVRAGAISPRAQRLTLAPSAAWHPRRHPHRSDAREGLERAQTRAARRRVDFTERNRDSMKAVLTTEILARLTELLEQGNLTVTQVAHKAGVRAATLRGWLSVGARAPTQLPALLRCATLARARAVGREGACRAAVEQVRAAAPPTHVPTTEPDAEGRA